MNDHRLIEHSGAWQGFTSEMARYPDDGLTVTVFVNLDADHARPYPIAHVVAGQDTSSDYDQAAGYRLNPLEKPDLAAALPGGWREAPMTLIQREDNRGGVRYGYRIGPAGNTRLLVVTIMLSGELTGYSISADPDIR